MSGDNDKESLKKEAIQKLAILKAAISYLCTCCKDDELSLLCGAIREQLADCQNILDKLEDDLLTVRTRMLNIGDNH